MIVHFTRLFFWGRALSCFQPIFIYPNSIQSGICHSDKWDVPDISVNGETFVDYINASTTLPGNRAEGESACISDSQFWEADELIEDDEKGDDTTFAIDSTNSARKFFFHVLVIIENHDAQITQTDKIFLTKLKE